MAETAAGEAALLSGLYAVPLILGSCVTLFAAAFVLYTYFRYDELRRHPNSIVTLRTILDAALAIVIIIEQSLRVDGKTFSCAGFSFFFELLLIGSELCFLALSYDLYTAIHNPFIDYKANFRKYLLAIFAVAIIMAGALVGSGPQVYGLTRFGQCWVNPTFSPVSGYNWAFLYWLLVVVFGVATFVILNARKRLSRGLRDTYEARVQSFSQGLTLLVVYGGYWLFVAIFYWSSLPYSTAPTSNPAAWLFCFFFGMRGLSTMLAWLKNHKLSQVAEKQRERERLVGGSKYGKVNRQLQPNLNLALRREILHYTTLAIRLSVLRCVPQEKMMEMVETMKAHLRRASSSTASGANGSAEASGSSGTASPSLPSVGGGLQHAADVAIAAGARVAPYNDRSPRKADEDLSYDWRPTNIALMASLFEGGGPLDLGEFTPAAHSLAAAKNAAAAKAAANAGASAEGSAVGANSFSNPAAGQGGRKADGGAAAGAVAGANHRSRHLAAKAASVPSVFEQEEGGIAAGSSQPSSASEGGVIKRPRLELRDLAPEAFGRIRDLFGVSPAQFFYSLSRTTKERFSEGASGAFMCFSHDMKFVLKTMEKDEAEVLRRMLPAYLKHLRDNRDTLVIRFYACMSLRLYRETLYFVVMENIFPTRATIHERFDLKGSWVNRSASKGTPGTVAYCRFCNERFRIGAPSSDNLCKARPNRLHVANTVLKDNDLTFKVRLDPAKSIALGDQLRSDVEFLRSQGVMDYSLLIGVHNRKFKVDNLEVMQKLLASVQQQQQQQQHQQGQQALAIKDEESPNPSPSVRFAPGTRNPAPAASSGGGGAGAAGSSSSLIVPSGRVPLVMRNSVALTMLAEPAEGETSPRPSGSAAAGGAFPLGGAKSGAAAGGGRGVTDARIARFSNSLTAPAQGPSVLAEEEVDFDDGAGSHTALTMENTKGNAANSGQHPHPLATANPYFHAGVPSASASGIHDPSAASSIDGSSYVPFFRADGGGMSSAIIEGPGLFYIGVIDILQEWSFIKKAERWLKRLLLLQDPGGMSVMPPEQYADRFVKRVIEAVIEGQEASSATSAAAAASGMSPQPRYTSGMRGMGGAAAAGGAGGNRGGVPGAAGRLAIYQPFSPGGPRGGPQQAYAQPHRGQDDGSEEQYYYRYQQRQQPSAAADREEEVEAVVPRNAATGHFFPEGEGEEDYEPPHNNRRAVTGASNNNLPFSPSVGVARSPAPRGSNTSSALQVGSRVKPSSKSPAPRAVSAKRMQQLGSYFPASGPSSSSSAAAGFNSPAVNSGRVRVAPTSGGGGGGRLAKQLQAVTASLPYSTAAGDNEEGK